MIKIKITYIFIILTTISCSPKITKVFYNGNNKSCATFLSIKAKRELTQNEIKTIIQNSYIEFKLNGQLTSIIKKNNEPYLYIKSNKINEINKEFEIIELPFKKIKNEFEQKITSFKASKNNSILKDHNIYGIYFDVGNCEFSDYDHSIYIISKDKTETYYYTNIYDNIVYEPIKLTHIGNEFRFKFKFQEDKIEIERIMYEQSDKNLLYKSLQYVSEIEDKYSNYLYKIE